MRRKCFNVCFMLLRGNGRPIRKRAPVLKPQRIKPLRSFIFYVSKFAAVDSCDNSLQFMAISLMQILSALTLSDSSVRISTTVLSPMNRSFSF